MAWIIDIGIPLVTILIMTTVGLDLTVADFRRIVNYPKALLVGTLGQIILLPLLSVLLIWSFSPPRQVAAGLLLVAAAPGGALSNLYVYLAGANTALSISLTALATIGATLFMPTILVAGFALLMSQGIEVGVPVWEIVRTLLFILVLPVLLGMFIRCRQPALVTRHRKLFRRLSIVALLFLLAVVAYDQWELILKLSGQMAVVALLFSLLAMGAGWLLVAVLQLEKSAGFALLVEFPVRNLAVVALIGTTLSDNLDFVAFGAVFLLVQAVIMFPVVVLYRRSVDQS
ncbi:MAG: bile acid:sodium symporter [Pseudomonadota bacterium]|nr:bile acid:sodium symporter [Pseudomonadota bacterium]